MSGWMFVWNQAYKFRRNGELFQSIPGRLLPVLLLLLLVLLLLELWLPAVRASRTPKSHRNLMSSTGCAKHA